MSYDSLMRAAKNKGIVYYLRFCGVHIGPILPELKETVKSHGDTPE
jgi:hypothetical protein